MLTGQGGSVLRYSQIYFVGRGEERLPCLQAVNIIPVRAVLKSSVENNSERPNMKKAEKRQSEINGETYKTNVTSQDKRNFWKTKHPWQRFQNFRQSCVLSTDQIEIHQSQPASMT